MLKTIAVFVGLLTSTVFAAAQSSPNLISGQVPTAAQWNGYFAAKQDVLNFVPVNKAGDTMSGRLIAAAPTTAQTGLRLPIGVDPTTPVAGNLWPTSAGLFFYDGSKKFWLTQQGGSILISSTVDFNATGDTAFAIALPPGFTRYLVSTVRISGASADLSAATFGVFTAASGGGTAIVAGSTAITVTATASTTNNNAQAAAAVDADTRSYTLATVPSIYFNVGAAVGSAATGSVSVTVVPLP